MWDEPAVGQVWVKTKEQLTASSYFGAAPAKQPRHPIPGADSENCTEQLGVPGPSGERLPHFRLGFTPSGGDELQSEYVVARKHGADAVRELRRLGGAVSPLLLTSEIRTVAADTLWLSPFYEQDSIAFHFTWKPRPDEVLAVLPRIESALAPFGARPHWGKLFAGRRETSRLSTRSCRTFGGFCRRSIAGGKFRNEFISRYVGRSRLSAGDVGEPVRVRPVPSLLAAVEPVDLLDVVRLELEVEQLEVLGDPRRCHRLGEDDVAALDVPAQGDLCR